MATTYLLKTKNETAGKALRLSYHEKKANYSFINWLKQKKKIICNIVNISLTGTQANGKKTQISQLGSLSAKFHHSIYNICIYCTIFRWTDLFIDVWKWQRLAVFKINGFRTPVGAWNRRCNPRNLDLAKDVVPA